MNDTLASMHEDPVQRKYHHDKMTFGLVYACNEHIVLPLSHDEVVHGKRSILGRMPGDDWQRFANLRAYYALMFAHPGKKLLFMGNDIAQHDEWKHDRTLDWHLLEFGPHRGVHRLIADLNALYRSTPALYEKDFDGGGFEWIDYHDRDSSVLSWIRRDHHGGIVVCVVNLTPIVRDNYPFGVPCGGNFQVLLNSDDETYGGSGQGATSYTALDEGQHGRPHSLRLCLPPLATLILQPASGGD